MNRRRNYPRVEVKRNGATFQKPWQVSIRHQAPGLVIWAPPPREATTEVVASFGQWATAMKVADAVRQDRRRW